MCPSAVVCYPPITPSFLLVGQGKEEMERESGGKDPMQSVGAEVKRARVLCVGPPSRIVGSSPLARIGRYDWPDGTTNGRTGRWRRCWWAGRAVCGSVGWPK